MMQINGSTALITGANRGLGRHFAEQLLARGANVYAAARNPQTVDTPGVTPIAIDVTDAESITAAAQATGDVTLLINNAGSSTGAALLDGPWPDIQLEMNTHYFGTLAVIRAFALQLAAGGEGERARLDLSGSCSGPGSERPRANRNCRWPSSGRDGGDAAWGRRRPRHPEWSAVLQGLDWLPRQVRVLLRLQMRGRAARRRRPGAVVWMCECPIHDWTWTSETRLTAIDPK
jgi:NAD(P)-dependent dehydrogenase (short-subunit alcohol dehydrogenase family)